ncbi:styrene monooxygenase/indole monooxygenase family protein [Gordonia sp. OPL2]|uniref:styrene monooxygenase/indole monooxygenase family protein n=1 Tax=Gordonia sp. OPL2 TaxID=2486274 RepID=UPI001654E7A9|nr:styrene monooxygenase/indole monooxygenase family protein [Gordonia sp. OPL2]ROZ89160.1 cadherin repeat domain-containing protein [Gordonia sp. OPL2]
MAGEGQSGDARRTVAIVGAGLAGTSAALGFTDAGFDVTLYSDRDRESLRDKVPPTGVGVLFGKPREWDAEIIDDLYEVGNTTGISVRLHSGSGADRADVLEFNPDYGYVAQAVDLRLRADDRLGRFLDKGGRFEVTSVDTDRIDAIAGSHDLTLVATGKGGLSALFPVNESRTHYREPQRRLLQVTLTGLDHGPDTFAYRSSAGGDHSLFNLDSENGEIFVGPFLHKDAGATWSFIVFAKTDGAWAAKVDEVEDAASARQTILDIFTEYFPHDAPAIEKLQVIEADPVSWLKGAVTPTVRHAVATTRGGHTVAAIGDTAIAVDPVAGQGAANTLIQVAELVKAAKTHDGEFSTDWLEAEFEKHWQRRGWAAVEVTRLYLGDPDYATHLELSFPAAAVDTNVASALFGLLSDPNPLLTLGNRDDVLGFITAVSGEPADDVLGRFEPAGRFSSATESATAVS